MSELTKRALEQSLKNLLLQKPLNKITISDIADDCGINRMTFYYHFKDIYDLVEWSCQEDAAKALAGKKTYETWQQGFEQIFEAVLANKPFIMNVYHSVSREQVENYLYQLTYDLLEGVVEEQAAGMSVRPEDKAFIANVYKYAFVGLMLDWIKHDMKGEPKQIIDRLDLVLHGSITAALGALPPRRPIRSARLIKNYTDFPPGDKTSYHRAFSAYGAFSGPVVCSYHRKGNIKHCFQTFYGGIEPCIIRAATMKHLQDPKSPRAWTTNRPISSAAAWPR